MWSVWTDSLDIYLSPVLALAQDGKGDATRFDLRPGDRLASTLQRVTELCAGHNRRRRRVRVALGGSYCPAIGFSVPSGLTDWTEYQSFAESEAAGRLGATPGQLRLAVNPDSPGLAAAVPLGLWEALREWSSGQGGLLHSVRPAWSLATACRAVRASGCDVLRIEEPDSVTVVSRGPTPLARTFSSLETFSPADDNRVLRLRMTPDPTAADPAMPAVFRPHWTLA